jgi:hypothetical protein
VANQSTKLKFMTDHVHYDQVTVLYARMKTPDPGNAEAMRKWNEEREKADKFAWMPKVEFSISPIDAVGHLRCHDRRIDWGGAEGHNNDLDRDQRSPSYNAYLVEVQIDTKPLPGFSEIAIEVSDEMFKEVVNDWTASQNLP